MRSINMRLGMGAACAAGLLSALCALADGKDGKGAPATPSIASDASWKATNAPPAKEAVWSASHFDDGPWPAASVCPSGPKAHQPHFHHDTQATSIWADIPGNPVCLRKALNLKTPPRKVIAHVAADDAFRLYVNGLYVGEWSTRWGGFEMAFDLAPYLAPGRNVIAVRCEDFGCGRWFALEAFEGGQAGPEEGEKGPADPDAADPWTDRLLTALAADAWREREEASRALLAKARSSDAVIRRVARHALDTDPEASARARAILATLAEADRRKLLAATAGEAGPVRQVVEAAVRDLDIEEKESRPHARLARNVPRAQALDLLARGEAEKPFHLKEIAKPDPAARAAAPPGAAEKLLELACGKDKTFAQIVWLALGELESPPDLIGAVGKLKDMDLALAAGAALAKGGDRTLAPKLAALLASDNPRARAAAAFALGTIGARSHAGALAGLVGKDSIECHRAAILALRRLTGKSFDPGKPLTLEDEIRFERESWQAWLAQGGSGAE